MEKKLLIVDGTSILAEAYYKSLTKEVDVLLSLKTSGKNISLNEEELAYSTLLQSKKGTYINAVQGFFTVLFDALDKTNPSHLIVAWGAQREHNFRRKIFPGYKDDGKIKDRQLLDQEDLTKNLLKDMGICQLESKNSEALDLAGSLISKYKRDFKIELLARNTLALQFSGDATVWLRLNAFKDIQRRFNLDCSNFPNNSIRFDEEFLLKYKNLKPYQLPDYRALIGNSFSKIPGVKAVGEVTTLALLEEYGCIENIYADIDACNSQHDLVDFGNSLTKYLTLPFNPIPFLVKGRNEAFLGKQLATYERNEASVMLTTLHDSEFNLNNVSKVDIIKKLKSFCLAPITCNITKGLIEVIEDLDYSSLIITYNHNLLSNSSGVFASSIEDAISLDTLELELIPCSDFKEIVNISDRAIIAFGTKVKFTLPKDGHYSKGNVMNRLTVQANKQTEAIIEQASIDTEECKVVEENSIKEDLTSSDNNNIANIENVIIENDDKNESIEAIDTCNNEANVVTNNKGLSLLEQLTINKYFCNHCREEFLVVNSSANYCIKCGAINTDNN